VIVASGSEVHVAVSARDQLEKEGKRVRVVSAPCLERFEKQNPAYRKSVIPDGVKRVSIEAGRTPPWHAVLGQDALTIGIDRFGASAPDKVLAQKFGLTADQVAKRIKEWLGAS